MVTLLDCIKSGGTPSVKGKSFVDVHADGAVYTVKGTPRLAYGRFQQTKARIKIQYNGEQTPLFTSIKSHYDDVLFCPVK